MLTAFAPPPAALELEELDPHASNANAAIPAAPPVSAVRRVNCRKRLYGLSSSSRSSHSSRSTASPTTSSADILAPLSDGNGRIPGGSTLSHAPRAVHPN